MIDLVFQDCRAQLNLADGTTLSIVTPERLNHAIPIVEELLGVALSQDVLDEVHKLEEKHGTTMGTYQIAIINTEDVENGNIMAGSAPVVPPGWESHESVVSDDGLFESRFVVFNNITLEQVEEYANLVGVLDSKNTNAPQE